MCWIGLGHLIKPVSKDWLGTESCSQAKYLDAVQPTGVEAQPSLNT